ncbi:MAG: hypothetical protein JW955_18265 [Sedimentisphaerales bacterium]|nr:hypothetical protein [Sedimentisphaerales bacterium]
MANGKERTLPLDGFLFPRVFRAFRMSVQPTKLIIALCALAIICLTGWIMDLASQSVAVAPDGVTELDTYVRSILEPHERPMPFTDTGGRTGVFATLWTFTARNLHAAVRSLFQVDVYEVIRDIVACFTSLVWAFRYHVVYSLIFFTVVLAVLSLAGGAICRIAALQFAGMDRPGLREAVRFALRKFTAFFTAPLTPIFVILVIGATIILLGLWGNVPYVGELTVGLFLPLALAAAVVIAVIALGIIGGLSLMFPTIAYEDSDCFDSISRSFSYVYAKPWRMALYMVIAFVYGAICYLFVRFFSFLVLWITHTFLQLGFMHRNSKLLAMWPEPAFVDFFGAGVSTPSNWSTSIGSSLIYFWVLLVVGLVVAFVISFYFSASTVIYALMRNRVDLIPIEEVYVQPPQETAKAPVTSSEQTPSGAEPYAPDEPDSTQEAPA